MTWQTAKIRDLGNGVSPTLKAGPYGSAVTKATYVQTGYKLYGQQEVVARSLDSTGYFVSPETYRRHSTCDVKAGDILITMMGTIGESYVIPPSAPEGIINPRLLRLRVDAARIDPHFVGVVLSQPSTRRELYRAAQGGTMAGLNAVTVGNLAVPLPPLKVQRKIAEIVGCWDDAIAAAEMLRARVANRADGLHELVLRPPLGSGPVRPLGDFFTERIETTSDDLPLLSVTQRGGVVRQSGVGRKDSSSTDRSQYKVVRAGDIAYNTMRMWQGAAGAVTEDGIVSPAYTVIRPDEDRVHVRFAAHLFKAKRLMFDFERYSQGLTSDTWNLKYPAFAAIPVSLPTLSDQHLIANALDAMHYEIELLDREIELLREQKGGLAEQLLSGKIRVKQPDRREL